MNDQSLYQAVDELGTAFTEFKHAQEVSIKNTDVIVKEKIDRLQDRMTQIETTFRRPGMAIETTHEKSGFLDYVRKGEEAGLQVKALTSTTDASGGFLIPKPILDKIHTTLQAYSTIRNIARVTEVSTDALELLLDRGQADVGWVAETADRPETNTPELAKVRIPVHQLYAKPRASQKLLDDSSVDLESWLAGKIADRMATVENQTFVGGDGTHKPKGFMTYPLVPLGEGQWGRFEEIRTGKDGILDDADVLIKTFHSLKPQYLKGAVWLMPRTALASIRVLKDTTGQYLWQPGLIAGTSSTLLGHPVVVCDDMPALVRGRASPSLAFGNWFEGYQIVDRQGINVLRDPYSAKPYVEFYTTKRVGGDVTNFEAIKIINCARN